MNKGDRTTATRTKKAGPRIRVAAIFVLTLLAPFHAFGEAYAGQAVTFEADPELQAGIKRTMNALNEEEMRKELDNLRKLGGRNYKKLVPQLLYYSVHRTDDFKGDRRMREAMAMGFIAERLRIRKSAISHALIPYIDTKDSELKGQIRALLRDYENPSDLRPPDFSLYRSIIAGEFRNGQELSHGLVRYMYERDPGTALLTLIRVSRPRDRNETRTIRWAEHVIADVLWKHKHKFLNPDQVEPAAAEQLDKLSQNNHWWVRLYVAEIMSQHRGFRQSEIIQRLKQDEHPLVGKVMHDWGQSAVSR